MNITLKTMDLETACFFYKHFTYDPATFSNGLTNKAFEYSVDWVNAYYEKQKTLGRIHLAVMKNNVPVGEILFKNLDHVAGSCVFSIHLQNDAVKNQGIGTEATVQALKYAIDILKMKVIFADALISNQRSCHVLQKVGYQEIGQDSLFVYDRFAID